MVVEIKNIVESTSTNVEKMLKRLLLMEIDINMIKNAVLKNSLAIKANVNTQTEEKLGQAKSFAVEDSSLKQTKHNEVEIKKELQIISSRNNDTFLRGLR